MDQDQLSPNHHAHHQPFAGVGGLVAAVTLLFGRGGDTRLAVRLAELSAGSGERVVDVGSGPGVAARHAARLGAEVVAVDPSAMMIRVGRVANRAPGLRYALGSAAALPVPDGWATVVWSLATVHHWPDIDAGLREIARVLAPGGRFIAIERRVEAGASGLASHGWVVSQADAFAARCCALGLPATASEHQGGNRGIALAVVALAS